MQLFAFVQRVTNTLVTLKVRQMLERPVTSSTSVDVFVDSFSGSGIGSGASAGLGIAMTALAAVGAAGVWKYCKGRKSGSTKKKNSKREKPFAGYNKDNKRRSRDSSLNDEAPETKDVQ